MRACNPDLAELHRTMARIRGFEEACAQLWEDGLVSGELHLGIGEEAIVAGVVDHLDERDFVASDHRPSPPLLALGGDMVEIALELLGDDRGLCRGRGGHMHLFDRARNFASSGIVGASAPQACGFALATRDDGGVAVAFFGEGAANQGMVLEAWNLAVAWNLPVLFVVKDNGMAITTRSATVTGGRLVRRARGFGMPAISVDGRNVVTTWRAAGRLIRRARSGRGPGMLHARCSRREGHMQGDPLLRVVDDPFDQLRDLAPGLISATLNRSTRVTDTMAALRDIGTSVARAGAARLGLTSDPLARSRRRLGRERAQELERAARAEVEAAVEAAVDATVAAKRRVGREGSRPE